jgi:hypothetical protein
VKCECCDKPKKNCECPEDCKECDCKKSKNESYFDKFMDSILISEKKNPIVGDSPLRKRIERHQDRPGNKTIFR